MNHLKIKNKLLILVIFLVSFFIINWQGNSIYAENNTFFEKKAFTEATIDDNFSENGIIVVLNRKESLNFKSWSVNDFLDLDIAAVEDLTASSSEILQINMNKEKFNKSNNITSLDKTKINADEFRTILRLTLNEPGKANVLETIKKLEKRDSIISAEPDFELSVKSAASNTPNDSLYQWGLNGEHGIRAEQAWEMVTGSNTVMVGILDTGIDAMHPDLINRVNVDLSRDFTLSAPYIPKSVTDLAGHGTHVAGIVGAQGNNSLGISGVVQNVQLVSLRIVTYDFGNAFVSSLIAAITYAGVVGIPILNNSNGIENFFGTVEKINSFEQAILGYNGLFVTSAGNNSKDNDNNTKRFPSPSFRPDNLLSVGSIDKNGKRSSFSNWGKNTVDIFAPGEDILSTYNKETNEFNYKEKYLTDSGTSMAAPHVSGVAALLLSANPNLEPQELRNVIRDSADAIIISHPSGFLNLSSTNMSVKRLNAEAAVRSVAQFTTRALSDSTIEITGSIKNKKLIGNVEIPEILDGRAVISISDYAFENQNSCTGIVIPSTIREIGEYAFSDCSKLTNVIFAGNLKITTLPKGLFKNCTNIKEIYLPENIKYIEDEAFYGCSSLNHIEMNKNLHSIGNYAFAFNASLGFIAIPDSVSHIGNHAFEGCWKLQEVYFNSSSQLLEIGKSAFQNCSKLKKFTFPDNINTIEDSTFFNCGALESFIIPSNIITIGSEVFYNCTILTIYAEAFNKPERWHDNWNPSDRPVYWGRFGDAQYELQNGNVALIKYLGKASSFSIPATINSNGINLEVKIIEKSAFFACYNLETVTIPSTVTNIRDYAFMACMNLNSIIIPASVISIGYGVFMNCLKLRSITIPFVGNIAGGTINTHFWYIFGDSSSSLPNTLTSVTITGSYPITNYAFFECSDIETINIPQTLTKIAQNAFDGCTSLKNFFKEFFLLLEFNGNYFGTIMTINSTGGAYLGSNAPNLSSRLFYTWSSGDPKIATINEYATITAIKSGKTLIKAIYNDNQRWVGTIEIEVLPDNSTQKVYLQYGMDVRLGGVVSGTEVTGGKGNQIPVSLNPIVTMHVGYTRLICLGNDSPSFTIQDFIWSSENINIATVSEWGTITGIASGTVIIRGVFKNNSKYEAKIVITVLESFRPRISLYEWNGTNYVPLASGSATSNQVKVEFWVNGSNFLTFLVINEEYWGGFNNGHIFPHFIQNFYPLLGTYNITVMDLDTAEVASASFKII